MLIQKEYNSNYDLITHKKSNEYISLTWCIYKIKRERKKMQTRAYEINPVNQKFQRATSNSQEKKSTHHLD